MKFLITFLIFLNLSCNKKDQKPVEFYKGKLVLEGICMNYVIQLIDGPLNPMLYEQNWVNPNTNITYQNVFALGSICTFPTSIKQGDEFYFILPQNPVAQTCAQCQAYSPTPTKKIAIEIYSK